MTPLPVALGGTGLASWRLERETPCSTGTSCPYPGAPPDIVHAITTSLSTLAGNP